jgi:hypothetical protein
MKQWKVSEIHMMSLDIDSEEWYWQNQQKQKEILH